MHGAEHLRLALGEGKGAILIGGHLGNVEIIAYSVARLGYRVMGPMEHVRPERLYRYLESLRGRCGLIAVASDGSMRPLFRELQNGGLVAIAVDRNTTNAGSLVPFFGAPALLPDSHVRLAFRMGAPLVPVFGMRNPDRSLSVYVQPAIWLTATNDREADVRKGMARVVQVLEEYIGQHPEQWVVFQPVWKRPAETSPS